MAAAGLGVQLVGTQTPGARWLVRVTAQISVVWFLLTFSASALNGLRGGPWGKALLRNRRYLGLSYAVTHGAHTAALFWYANTKGVGFADLTSTSTLVLASIGNAFIVAMALTSTDGARRRLGGGRWLLLHRSGMAYIYLIFLFTYAVPTWRGEPLGILVFLALWGALGLRVANRLRLRRAAAARRR